MHTYLFIFIYSMYTINDRELAMPYLLPHVYVFYRRTFVSWFSMLSLFFFLFSIRDATILEFRVPDIIFQYLTASVNQSKPPV